MFFVDNEEYEELVSDLEHIIAKHCSTENLMNGNNYRYPVHFSQGGKKYVSKGNGKVRISKEAVPTMKYTFGAHTLEIGKALDEIVKYLDDRYGGI